MTCAAIKGFRLAIFSTFCFETKAGSGNLCVLPHKFGKIRKQNLARGMIIILDLVRFVRPTGLKIRGEAVCHELQIACSINVGRVIKRCKGDASFL